MRVSGGGHPQTLPANQRDTRVRNVEDYFTANGLGSILVPTEAGPAGTAPGEAGPVVAGPAGLTITISLQCPPSRDRYIGYRDGTSMAESPSDAGSSQA